MLILFENIEQGKRVMVEHNGIKLVTDLMQNSLASSKILARACFVLGNLAFHGEYLSIEYFTIPSLAREYCTDFQCSQRTARRSFCSTVALNALLKQ